MIWVGLTGGIACGKTTAANMLREMGVPVIDADVLARQALKNNKTKVISLFGEGIVDQKGEIDRRALGRVVFGDEKMKAALEGILHPKVQDKVQEKRRLFESAGKDVAIYDVPLLFEKNLHEQFDQVVVVYAPEALCLQRLIERHQLSEDEAKQRMANQMDIEEKRKLADHVIKNVGDRDELRDQVEAWLNELRTESHSS